ncbi:MAG: hypothetical protein U0793_03725 [Gemmataceae bacterium]
MRSRFVAALIGFGFLFFLVAAPGTVESQFRGGPGGGGPGGGGFDAGGLFDRMAKGRGFFLISETTRFNGPLTKFASEQGIHGEPSRIPEVLEQARQLRRGLRRNGNGQRRPRDGWARDGRHGEKDRNEAANAWAESEFKRRDRNDDGYLNMDEAPDPLKADFRKWDLNGDGLISLNEFRAYFTARFQAGARDEGDGEATVIRTIIEEEDLDKRPVVFRAGKLPKDLPSWFSDLDVDKDGQVALWEWRKGGKDLDEFRNYDLNDDGLITPEEALQHQALVRAQDLKDGKVVASAGERPFGGKGGFGPGGFGPGGGFGKGGKGKGGPRFEFKRPQ